jgi:hypothetical protein
MKRIIAGGASAAALMAVGLVLVACGRDAEPEAPAAVEAAASVDAPAVADSPAAASTNAGAVPAAPDAPDYAVLYPEATPVGPATVARGPSGPGGIATFTTPATPDAVVAFYRQRAEAAGLVTIASMNQGGASAYSAGDGASGTGKLLSVVATPGEDGPTNVQLSWTAGR